MILTSKAGFSAFRHVTHHHHLPRVQTQAGGGFFSFFSSFRRVTHHLYPPSCPNVSRRWCFLFFRHVTHHHLLPRIQTRAGGGVFRRFDASPTTSTSLASKREPVVLFVSFDATPTTSTSLASKREPDMVIFGVLMRLPPLSPPSRPNASWRWSISAISTRLPPSPPPSHPQRGGVHTTHRPI